jgi:5-methylcytosine-specific restriction endonuclease McrA
VLRRKLRDKCFYCGVLLHGAGAIDHMQPISKGGSNYPTNLTLACTTCNLDKKSKSAAEFVRWRILHEKHCTAASRNLLLGA